MKRAGKTHYVNLITYEVVSEKPFASIMDPTPVSQDWNDYGTAVMPRAVTLRKMARFDLHNAVCILPASMFVSVAYAMEYCVSVYQIIWN